MTTLVPPEMLASFTNTSFLSLMPIGTILPYAGSAVPAADDVTTFLLCDGSLQTRATYVTLFARLGTAYNTGGESGTVFRLPDLRGRVPAGRDDMGGPAASRITNAIAGFVATTLGAFGGDQRLQSHTHAITDPGHTHAMIGVGVSSIGADDSAMALGVGAGGLISAVAQVTGISTVAAGAGAGQNVQPSLIVNYLIRAL